MFENPRRGRQARSFTTNVPKILDLISSSEQIFFRKLSLGAPVFHLSEGFHKDCIGYTHAVTCGNKYVRNLEMPKKIITRQ